MKYRGFILLLLITLQNPLKSYSGETDSLGLLPKGLSIGGYIDTYYSFDLNQPNKRSKPYFVSQNQHNNFSINLAYLDIKFSGDRIRASLMPAFGTYMQSNYASETGGMRFLYEANVGVKLFEKRNIWLDAGIHTSPTSDENPISKNQLMYTRSISSESVPYYLSGLKLSAPLSNKINCSFYVVNGWQQINDLNNNKSVLVSLEYKPAPQLFVCTDIYYGNHKTSLLPNYRNRTYADVYALLQAGKKLKLAACFYAISQEVKASGQQSYDLKNIYSGNIKAQYQLMDGWSASVRAEFYNDAYLTDITPINPVSSFHEIGFTGGLNWAPAPNALIRFEARNLSCSQPVFREGSAYVTYCNWLTGSLAVWF